MFLEPRAPSPEPERPAGFLRGALLEPVDEALMQGAQVRLDHLTKPVGSLGRLETLARQIVGITRCRAPRLDHKAIVTIAADHGVAEEQVSAYPQAVTAQMVGNFLRGGAGINVLARHCGARVIIADFGVAAALDPHPGLLSRAFGRGTKNLARGPAMSREQASGAIQAGMEIVSRELAMGLDLVGTGEMGIANTTAASAISAAMTGSSVDAVTGRGTGIDEATRARKMRTIERALAVNRPDASDPLGVLAALGGFEIAGLVGVMLAGAQARRPVVLDGFISGAAALIAVGLEPHLSGYLIASHRSQEPGHQVVLDRLRLHPLLDLGLRLGEGTGAALAMPIIDAACRVLCEMATFEEAGVSEKSHP